MSCPHGVWHSEDCEMCQLEEKVSNAEAEVLKYKLLFVSAMIKVALLVDSDALTLAAADASLLYRNVWIKTYGQEVPMNATLLKELQALASGDSNG